MICSKILSVSKAFVRFRPAVRRGRLSPLWDAGGMTKNARVCKASGILADYGGGEGGLSPLLSYRGMRSHRILRKGAQACGNELLWRRGI